MTAGPPSVHDLLDWPLVLISLGNHDLGEYIIDRIASRFWFDQYAGNYERANMLKLLALFIFSTGLASGGFYGRDYERTAVGDAVDKASMRFLFCCQDIYDKSEDKNVISSPLGVLTLLALYSNGANGTSREEIVKLLGLPDHRQVAEAYQILTDKLSMMDSSYFTMANKVYVSNNFELTDQFQSVATTAYHSEVETLNFSNPRVAADVINQWADLKTHGYIKTPVSEDTFPPETAAALFNAIFFQGHWHVPFDEADTQDKAFYVSKSDSVEKPTMHLLQSLFYKENKDLGARMVELPYKEFGFRMIVVLPDAVDGLPAVIDKLSQNGILENVFDMEPQGTDVDLDMPKFDVNSRFSLKSILQKEGVNGIFDEEATGIVKGQGVAVSDVFQEAFVKVDEEGATAGAFTGYVLVATSLDSEPPPPLQFKVDRPFLYAILYEDIVLFTGTYTH
ncbi:antichymotrypsin-1-like [Battus philenor]|uniref:antichymotrypsin-1-like n=1 Tax=Battus philenor TaxID=42288 RepID=UPI0035CEA941